MSRPHLCQHPPPGRNLTHSSRRPDATCTGLPALRRALHGWPAAATIVATIFAPVRRPPIFLGAITKRAVPGGTPLVGTADATLPHLFRDPTIVPVTDFFEAPGCGSGQSSWVSPLQRSRLGGRFAPTPLHGCRLSPASPDTRDYSMRAVGPEGNRLLGRRPTSDPVGPEPPTFPVHGPPSAR